MVFNWIHTTADLQSAIAAAVDTSHFGEVTETAFKLFFAVCEYEKPDMVRVPLIQYSVVSYCIPSLSPSPFTEQS